MKIHVCCLLILLLATAFISRAQDEGEKLFKATCMACHTIGNGRLVGPDLKGVNEKVNQEWLISFIRSSQKMVKSGDSLAVALFKEYNQIPMPDNNLSDAQILSVLAYIKTTSGGQASTVTPADEQHSPDTTIQQTKVEYDDALVNEGNALFYGYKRFENGAPPCASCHFLDDGALVAGGSMSVNLSQTYGKMGTAGVNAILSNPPFPAMQNALKNKNLTEEEKEGLIALIYYVGQQKSKTGDFSDAMIFLALSLVLALFLLVHLYMFYDYRKIPS
ncbi:MAG: c-type cytochrome [Draconibacterium sp.]